MRRVHRPARRRRVHAGVPVLGPAGGVELRARRLSEGFQRPLLIDRREVSVGVSCGVAMFPQHGRDATSLLRAADAALFRAKDLGRNRLCIHDPVMLVGVEPLPHRAGAAQGDRGRRFRAALPAAGLARQPSHGHDGGAAALASQRHVDRARRRVYRVAEQSGLMLDLNDWVLETAASAVSDWRRGLARGARRRQRLGAAVRRGGFPREASSVCSCGTRCRRMRSSSSSPRTCCRPAR